MERPLFQVGRTLATPGAIKALEEADEAAWQFFQRHSNGDWGDVCKEDAASNDQALKNGGRLLSVYHTSRNQRLWLITEADRSASTLLLSDEY